jgi:hypothetical protein
MGGERRERRKIRWMHNYVKMLSFLHLIHLILQSLLLHFHHVCGGRNREMMADADADADAAAGVYNTHSALAYFFS